MINKYFTIFLCILLLSFNVGSTNIAVINIDFILSETNDYQKFIKKLEDKKNTIQKNLKEFENQLINKDKELKSSSLLYSQKELEDKYIEYNNEVKTFQQTVENHNLYFNRNYEHNKNIVIKQVVLIVRDLSIENNFELILQQNNYFLSSDNIDISSKVVELINQNPIILNFID